MRGSKNITERVGTSFVCGLLFGSLFVNSVTAVTLTGPDYAQNFDSLAGSGTTGTVLPLDWAISEVPTMLIRLVDKTSTILIAFRNGNRC